MKTKAEVVAWLQREFEDVYVDMPFHDDNWVLLRHNGNNRMFLAAYDRQGQVWLNCKAAPDWGDYWRQTYAAVVPAYHMNKVHWCSVILDGSMSEEEILEIITDSYELTRPKLRKKK